jgi:hypothetical protein
MNWHSFIFSEKKSERIARHTVFWMLWWIYFTASYFHYEQSGLQKIEFEPWNFPFFIRSVLLLSIQVAACYYFINFLMPRYLFRGKLLTLLIHTCILSILILISGYLIHKAIMPYVNTLFRYEHAFANQNIWWTSITSGLLSAPKVICAAAVVKLLKRWWLKQKEKERLEKEKLVTNLRLLKAQMHPEFLFSSLQNISTLTENRNIEKASQSLLKLADILSYMLYESDKDLVPVENEIHAVKCYLALEKAKMCNQLEMDISVKGNIQSKSIVPLILFPFIENCFSYFKDDKKERNWINVQFEVEGNDLTMKLIHGTNNQDCPDAMVMSKARERLAYYYTGQHELKCTEESEIMMTLLKIRLNETPGNKKHLFNTEAMSYAAL